MDILQKGIVFFPQNFHTKKLGQISVFYAMVKLNLTYYLFLYPVLFSRDQLCFFSCKAFEETKQRILLFNFKFVLSLLLKFKAITKLT